MSDRWTESATRRAQAPSAAASSASRPGGIAPSRRAREGALERRPHRRTLAHARRHHVAAVDLEANVALARPATAARRPRPPVPARRRARPPPPAVPAPPRPRPTGASPARAPAPGHPRTPPCREPAAAPGASRRTTGRRAPPACRRRPPRSRRAPRRPARPAGGARAPGAPAAGSTAGAPLPTQSCAAASIPAGSSSPSIRRSSLASRSRLTVSRAPDATAARAQRRGLRLDRRARGAARSGPSGRSGWDRR